MFTELFRFGLCLNSDVGLGWSHLINYQCFLTIKTRSKRCASTLGFLVEWWAQKTSEKIPQNLEGSTSQVSMSRRTTLSLHFSLFFFIRKTRLMRFSTRSLSEHPKYVISFLSFLMWARELWLFVWLGNLDVLAFQFWGGCFLTTICVLTVSELHFSDSVC